MRENTSKVVNSMIAVHFPPGFNIYRKDRRDGYGGVLLGVSSNLVSQQIQIESDVELVAAKIINEKKDIIIGALYRPPNSDQLYMDNLTHHIEQISASNQGVPVWIAGDVNLPDINWVTD